MNWKELKRRRLDYYRGKPESPRRNWRQHGRHHRTRKWLPWYKWIFVNDYAASNILLIAIAIMSLVSYVATALLR